MAALPLVIVAAVADNGIIGDDNRLIWRLKTDMRRFRSLTLGRPVLMGRKTYLSIGKPLPGRETIVLTRDQSFAAEGVHVAHGLDEAIAAGQRLGAAMGADTVVVAGGTDLYRQALPRADRLELTFVHATPDGDAVFPDWDKGAFEEMSRETHPRGPDDEHPFSFATFRRRA
ncbi:dihydrofolate reductase [Bosea sp. PAMC 26642]|uniref:dihydrofolate reductase n=1 Tax=Bosea sp. (strain PAMC 26642) TaxID=1792307 RepID=UPI000770157A|nr:dihydrofolate reductase [Bosea sp. PAMC 26642]AMJ60604.1 diacylglycerol kinase [Bosea sp. PAMC 26642]